MDNVDTVVVLAYAVLGLELRFWSVPSVASISRLLGQPSAASCAGKIVLVLPAAMVAALFVLPLAIALVPRALAFLGPIHLPQPTALVFGVVLLALGSAIKILSVPPLRRACQQRSLATSGTFCWSRNPILLGTYAFYLGNALIAPCALLWVGFPFCLAYMHKRVLIEETHLKGRFPEQYPDYAARVPRYLGLSRSR